MIPWVRGFCAIAVACSIVGPPLSAQTAANPGAELIRQAQQKQRDGNPGEAVALFRQALEASPRSFVAHHQLGMLLDLAGDYGSARKHLSMALQVSENAHQKAQAERALAISYAFDANCTEAAKYEAPLHEQYLAEKDFYDSGEIADELGRICIEGGKLDEATKWYHTGWQTGLREPDITPERRDLWDFRWEHAQARIAARRGNKAEAQKHVDAAKAVLDKGTNSGQSPFFSYLTGYVALYSGDYKSAITDLLKANQSDPFILALLAQSHEKLGDQAQATDYYRRVLAAPAVHNSQNALARSLAMKKVG